MKIQFKSRNHGEQSWIAGGHAPTIGSIAFFTISKPSLRLEPAISGQLLLHLTNTFSTQPHPRLPNSFMASAGINVLRWSALGLGVVYGVWHQSNLSAQAKHNHIQREYQHQTSLIEKAKEEYKKRLSPQLTAQGSGVITDPDDSRFDLEAYLKLKAGD